MGLRRRYSAKLTSSNVKWNLGLWLLAFVVLINLLAYLNSSDKDGDEQDLYTQKQVEDLIREKGKLALHSNKK